MPRKIVKILSIVFILLATLTGGAFAILSVDSADVDERVVNLKSYCRANGYNTDVGILVDYGRHSFQHRFYVVDLNTGDIVLRSLCGHGRGGKSNILKGEFSNISGSHCSSLGHYKIGRERKMYNYPINAFELDGLDQTNSNARARAILIHPSIGPRSLGCITLPFPRYKRVAKILHSQSKNVIMWTYE